MWARRSQESVRDRQGREDQLLEKVQALEVAVREKAPAILPPPSSDGAHHPPGDAAAEEGRMGKFPPGEGAAGRVDGARGPAGWGGAEGLVSTHNPPLADLLERLSGSGGSGGSGEGGGGGGGGGARERENPIVDLPGAYASFRQVGP